jgi:UDP-glucose 4-epimerase
MKKTLVTGGAGYIGSVVVERLLARGYEPVVLDNLSQGHLGALLPGVPFARADLLDLARIEEFFGQFEIEAVVHMAALALVGESVRDPLRYYRQNLGGLINLLEVMRGRRVTKLVFSSSAAVYGMPEQVPISEECATLPINPYGWTKWMSEQLLADLRSACGLNYVALRYFNVAGASERNGEIHDPETHLIPCVLGAALGRLPHVEILGTDYDTPDGTCIRDYIHVVDVADAHVLCLERLEDRSAIYNLGSGRGYSVREILACTEQVTGSAIPCRIAARRPGDPPRLVADHRKIERELGWTPKRGLEEMIQSAWQWYRRHPNGYEGSAR